ncbi:MAG: hypothetical protein LBD66_00390 [Holosporales bacterium]|nr:hypothetical protein [Holosporales bacterium]
MMVSRSVRHRSQEARKLFFVRAEGIPAVLLSLLLRALHYFALKGEHR